MRDRMITNNTQKPENVAELEWQQLQQELEVAQSEWGVRQEKYSAANFVDTMQRNAAKPLLMLDLLGVFLGVAALAYAVSFQANFSLTLLMVLMLTSSLSFLAKHYTDIVLQRKLAACAQELHQQSHRQV